MSPAQKVFDTIYNDLSRGYADMALLGESSKSELRIESPESLQRYAEMMRPNIAIALNRSRSTELLIYVLLTVLFAMAIALTVFANKLQWGWIATASSIPGLGATAVWPIRTLIRLRRENLKLGILPDLLPLLQPKDGAKIIKNLFLEGGKLP